MEEPKKPKRRLTLVDVNDIVREMHGGSCIEITSIKLGTSTRRRGKFVCANGHTWDAALYNVLTGIKTWCPACRRITIEDCQKLAQEKGGICVSTIFVNSSQKLTWQCKEGHQWDTWYTHIKSGQWCRQCRMYTIEDARQAAIDNGGLCLSIEYISSSTIMQWQCDQGHTWGAAFQSIVAKHWCKKCFHIQRRCTQKSIDELAESKGGKCLSFYNKSSVQMLWKCDQGHTWEASYTTIKSGSWCPRCAFNRKMINRKTIDELAELKGGKCLSEYKGAGLKMTWVCSQGHNFETSYNGVKSGVWCPTCTHITPMEERINQILEKNGGICYSRYVGVNYPMDWECKKGHKWTIGPADIFRGTWCPYCKHKSEAECKAIFENLFKKPFIKVRPDWIRNETGNCLELDGYNEELKLAFEYNGEQHYMVAEWWGETQADLDKQIEHDRIKKQACENNGIQLVVIPYTFKKYDDKVRFITQIVEDKLKDYVNN